MEQVLCFYCFRASEVANWRDPGNEEEGYLSWRMSKHISEEPAPRQSTGRLQSDQGPNTGGIIKIPHPINIDSSYSHPNPHSHSRTPQLFNPHNPSQPISVHGKIRAPISQSNTNIHNNKTQVEYFLINGKPIVPPVSTNAETGSALPESWYHKNLLSNPSIGKEMLQLVQINNEMHSLLNEGRWLAEYARLQKLRDHLKTLLSWFICRDVKFCQQENLEMHLWKLCFYNVIETVHQVHDPAFNRLQQLNHIIEDGLTYFETLLETVETKYEIKINSYLNKDGCTMKNRHGYVLQSALKIYIFLGDLSRYKATFNNTNDFSIATEWYTKANQLNPRNGRPFNLLGKIAVKKRRQLDAIYYYTRSLLTTNYFRSCHEILVTVFDENRKKYETSFCNDNSNQILFDQKKKETREYRREIWIHPEENVMTQRNQLINDSDSEIEAEAMEKLLQLSHVELMKQFICSFLMVHGKLYSKTGLESLQQISKQMLREFKLLLKQNGFDEKKLLQLLSINMFAIEITQLKEKLDENYKSLTQELALIIFLEMFYCVVHQCNLLFIESPTCTMLTNEQFNTLLPAIKIWCDWFVCQPSIWNPPPSCSDYHTGPHDVWTELAFFINNLLSVEYNSVLVPCEDSIDPDDVLVVLPEDVLFVGFKPLLSNIQEPVKTRSDTNISLAQACFRIKIIVFFGTEYLVGIDPPVLRLYKTDSGTDEYISIVEVKDEESDDTSFEENVMDFELYEDNSPKPVPVNFKPLPTDLNTSMPSEYKELLHKRQILNEQEEQSEMKKRILESHKKIRIQLEIKPHFLVPDTNCFIDYLPELKLLANKKCSSVLKRNLFTILIPCIVFNELLNISKSIKKAPLVVENAQRALHFIQNSTIIKYVTTKGTFLSKTIFSTGEDDLVMKNDDKILETCVSLTKRNSKNNNNNNTLKNSNNKTDKKQDLESETIKEIQQNQIDNNIHDEQDNVDGLQIIFRDVVLLTEDRNLRLKALTRDIPVTNIENFNKWCNLRNYE